MARGLAVSQEELSKRMFHHERHHHHHPPTIAEGQVEAKGDDQADEVWRVDVHVRCGSGSRCLKRTPDSITNNCICVYRPDICVSVVVWTRETLQELRA